MADCSQYTKLCEEIGLGEHNYITNLNHEALTIRSGEKNQLQLCTNEERSCCSPQECSMCGDVGLTQHLFKCLTCSHRYQHTYCSRYYPHKMAREASICNWCLPSEDLSEACDINICKADRELVKPGPLQGLEDDRRLQVKKHTKAFEYLLQIAERHHNYNIPGVNNIEENKSIVGAILQKNGRCNLASPSNCTEKKSFAWRGNMANRQRHRHHNSDDDDVVAEEIPMHYINKSSTSSLNRWTRQTAARRELRLCPPRAINRRYKLLADVLC